MAQDPPESEDPLTQPERLSADRAESGDAPGVSTTTASVQYRALNAVNHAATRVGAAHLLESTGPLAELTNAERLGVLTDAKRILVAKKGAGVVFEAMTVTRVQHASAQYGLVGLTASLSATSNDSRVDVLVGWRAKGAVDLDLGYQLKTGQDKYLKAVIGSAGDDALLLVPRDFDGDPQGRARRTIQVPGLDIETPTREEIRACSEETLERLSARRSPVDLTRVARQALRDALVDGIAAAALDLAIQQLSNPNKPVDWERAAKVLSKAGATSAIGSFLATTNACSSVRAAKHAIDASGAYVGTRVAACVVPRAIDVAFDFAAQRRGDITTHEFGRRTSRNLGALAAELIFFKYLARLGRGLGPIGQAVFMVCGGMIVAKFGEFVGEAAFSLLSELFGTAPPPTTAGEPEPTADSERQDLSQLLSLAAVSEIRSLATRARREEKRIGRRAARGVCMEVGCSRKHHARGRCSLHYQRWWRAMRRAGYRLPRRSSRRTGAIRHENAAKRHPR